MSEITNDTKPTGSSKNAPAAPPAGNGPKLGGGGVFRVWPNGEFHVGYLDGKDAHKSRIFRANEVIRVAKEPEVFKQFGDDVANITKSLKVYVSAGTLIPISEQMATAIEAEAEAAASDVGDDES